MKKKKVLVIDDDDAYRRVLKVLLTKENIEPFLAYDGETGFETAVSELPDIILLDLFMPETDGFELLKLLKNSPELKDIPVIIFSITESDDIKEKAFNLGAIDYISKPFDMQEIVLKIKKYL